MKRGGVFFGLGEKGVLGHVHLCLRLPGSLRAWRMAAIRGEISKKNGFNISV